MKWPKSEEFFSEIHSVFTAKFEREREREREREI